MLRINLGILISKFSSIIYIDDKNTNNDSNNDKNNNIIILRIKTVEKKIRKLFKFTLSTHQSQKLIDFITVVLENKYF